MNPYPKPSDIGGTLIRRVIALFKEHGRKLPIRGRIAIATSGGVDSMVLAHLLCRYGRKVIADPAKQVTLVHFDHQWRPESGGVEPESVNKLADALGVRFLSVKLDSPNQSRRNDNLEADARLKRLEQFAGLRAGKDAFRWILTAHHEDDVVETLVWRFLRGELLTHREGILFHHDGCLRPLLKVRKEEIYEYARAEGVAYQEDPTNRSRDQMRGYLREDLFPQLESRFPGFKTRLVQYVKTPAGQRAKAGRKSR